MNMPTEETDLPVIKREELIANVWFVIRIVAFLSVITFVLNVVLMIQIQSRNDSVNALQTNVHKLEESNVEIDLAVDSIDSAVDSIKLFVDEIISERETRESTEPSELQRVFETVFQMKEIICDAYPRHELCVE